MTQQEIKTGNKLIAEFMGAKEDYYPEKLPRWYENSGRWEDSISTFQYHLSWDWLMPVVEKIESISIKGRGIIINYTSAGNGNFMLHIYHIDYVISIKTGRVEEKRKAYFFAIVEFIKWYNQQTK